MIDVYVDNKPIAIPSSWAELAKYPKLLEYTINLFFLELTKTQIKSIAVLKYLNFSDDEIEKTRRYILHNEDPNHVNEVSEKIFTLAEHVKFITDKPIVMEENPYPQLGRLIGCSNILKDFTIWEYALAEIAFFDYKNTGKQEDLDRFIAIWYRPRKSKKELKKTDFDGDKRVIFNDNNIAKYLKQIAKISQAKKQLIYYFFLKQREKIVKAHPNIFSGGDTDGDGGTWADTIISMSKVGDEKKTSDTKLAIILRRIENDSKAYKEMQRKTKSNKL